MTTPTPLLPPPIEYVVALISPTLHTEFVVRRGDDDGALWYVGRVDRALPFPTWDAAEEAAAMVRAAPVGDIYRVVVLPTQVGQPVEYERPPRPWYRRLLTRLGL
ncbi:MAG TPA: hypothetical protein VFS43_14125 [Polyangiaceae bacterium]|nr:hypothetical protein [Polyangiaceae bacterium]